MATLSELNQILQNRNEERRLTRLQFLEDMTAYFEKLLAETRKHFGAQREGDISYCTTSTGVDYRRIGDLYYNRDGVYVIMEISYGTISRKIRMFRSTLDASDALEIDESIVQINDNVGIFKAIEDIILSESDLTKNE